MERKHADTAKVPGSQDPFYAQMDRSIATLDSARKELLERPGVIGVGYGFKEKDGRILEDVPAIVVYMQEKKDKKNLNSKEIIPSHIEEVPTDVVQFGQRTSPVHHRNDGMWLDQGKIHATNPHKEIFLEPRADQDVDHVAVLEIDNTFVNGNNIDFVKAVKRFLTAHPDAFDFITFYVDTSTGLPDQGSYHSGVYNKTTGINYYAGGNLDIRATYGSQKLLAIQPIGWIGNQVLLQETGHMWAAYVRNRDTQNGANRFDLLISTSGQGLWQGVINGLVPPAEWVPRETCAYQFRLTAHARVTNGYQYRRWVESTRHVTLIKPSGLRAAARAASGVLPFGLLTRNRVEVEGVEPKQLGEKTIEDKEIAQV